MVGFRTLDDVDVAGKRVLVRADLNVPTKDGVVTDATRIDRFAPTVKDLIARGARVIVLSHFDRPDGQARARQCRWRRSPRPWRRRSAMTFALPTIASARPPIAALKQLGNGDVALLENLRYYDGEEANDPAFVRDLAALGDLYVNDAFSAAHRAHASTEGLARALPAFAGRQMQAELNALSAALENPAKPVAALVGGAKISTKIDVLNHLIARVDALIVGGAMANTFLFAKGIEVGKSLCERNLVETARAIWRMPKAPAARSCCRSMRWWPNALKEGAEVELCTITAVPADTMILDIGAATAWQLDGKLARSKTLLWNGPFGAFEIAPFDAGTVHVAQTAARLTKAGQLISVAGGGDTVAALNAAGVTDQFTYVSTAGGAFLEWLEGKTLPGVAALLI